MIDLDHGFFLVRVYSKKDYPHVLPNGPWGEIGHYLTQVETKLQTIQGDYLIYLSLGASLRDPDFIKK